MFIISFVYFQSENVPNRIVLNPIPVKVVYYNYDKKDLRVFLFLSSAANQLNSGINVRINLQD